MKNLYKLEEYSGRLPNPEHFPVRGADILALKGKPYVFCDGFILDLSVRESDKEELDKRVTRTLDVSGINSQLEEALESLLLLSEPEFIYDTTYPAYIVFTPCGNPVGIQIKYYKYFRNRYPKCDFYIKGEGCKLVTIRLGDKIKGMCMAMFLEDITLKSIKEERNA